MIKYGLLAVIAAGVIGSLQQAAPQDRERRLNPVIVKTLPPDKGELHINPIIRRPQEFQRPGFTEMELVFVPVALIEDHLEPLLGEENRDYLRLVTQLPKRADGVAFDDTPKDYFTKSVILPRGLYVLSEVKFRQSATGDEPDMQTVSYCLADESFLVRVKGGDVMFMGRPEFQYPSRARIADPKFSPARNVLDNLVALKGWRWTTKDLVEFDVVPTNFDRTPAFCSPQAATPSS